MKRKHVFSLVAATVVCAGALYFIPHKKSQAATVTAFGKDTTTPAPDYTLTYDTAVTLHASWGTKSVLFNTTGTKLYAMNLEGMSIYEFDAASKAVTRVFKFRGTKGKGWDYDTHAEVDSYEEKPVEACFSHNDNLLWVSLHNASGIVPIALDSLQHDSSHLKKFKKVFVYNKQNQSKDSTYVPLIKTGKTPKVITRSADNQYLMVSNWHSNTVSVLNMWDTAAPFGKVKATISVKNIPRGMAVDEKKGKSYIAIMGGSSISVVNNTTWKIEKNIQVASSPRHIVLDTAGRLYASFNNMAEVACINPATGKTLFKAATAKQPRTIVLSKDGKFLFVTCYEGNTLEVFKVMKNQFIKVHTLECKGKPVGVDIHEDEQKIEAWVCNYVGGNIKVFTFLKQLPATAVPDSTSTVSR